MKFPSSISRRNRIILFVLLVLVFIWAILRFFILHYDPVRPFVITCFEPYLLLTERLSNFFLSFTSPGIIIENYKIFYEQSEVGSFTSGVLFKKLTFFLFFLCWIIKAPLKKKILFTAIIIVTNFVIVSIDNAIMAHLVLSGYDDESFTKISKTPGLLAITTLFVVWIQNNRTTLLNSLAKFRLNTKLIDNKIPEIIIVLYVYVILNNFIYGYLDLHVWRNLLAGFMHKILALLGYESVIQGYNVLHDDSGVFIDKGCVGFNTILQFSIIVFITGVNNIRRWSYISAGFIFLNIVNCLRLILIFTYVYDHGNFDIGEIFHESANYVTYAVIFIIWIIWFEFFTDIRQKQGNRKGKVYPIFVYSAFRNQKSEII